jgi:two-component system response regulator
MSEPFILLVEDNPSDEELMLRALRRAEITTPVVVARDGVAALDCLFGCGGEEPARLPLVVFLDLNLPKLGGLEVLRKVREHKATQLLPVVILTSSGESGDLLGAYRLGANSYVVKPVAFDRFAEVVRQLGQYWTGINHPLPE